MNTTLSIPKELAQKARKKAQAQNSNLSAVVRQFLEDFANDKYSVSLSVHPVFDSVEEEDEYLDKIEFEYYQKHPEELAAQLAGGEDAVDGKEFFGKYLK